jgi:hypothetical protein
MSTEYESVQISRFENKPHPIEAPETKIVEAFGLGKCPKLVQQVGSLEIDVRVNALVVLCDEFRNPYSIDGCVRAGVIPVIAQMIVDPDFNTRLRASEALHIAAGDANGLKSILEYRRKVFPNLLAAVQDPSEQVRFYVFGCLNATTRTAEGVEANVEFGITTAFVDAVRRDSLELKPAILQTLHNLVSNEQGLEQALQAHAVEAFIDLLERQVNHTSLKKKRLEDAVIADAARTLGFLCYDGRAKSPALQHQAVSKLVALLKEDELDTKIRIAVTSALMSISITNDGKMQVYEFEGLDIIMRQLYDNNRVVVLNTLKIISNLAVYPKNREAFTSDSTCVVKLRKLSKYEDSLIAKHAGLALEAVNWNP